LPASPIRVRLIPPFSRTAPFVVDQDMAELRAAGVEFVEDGPADVRVLGKLGRKQYLSLAREDRKTPILVWTDEPRDDWSFVSKRSGWGLLPDTHFMNCYTGDVFFDNYRFALMTEPLEPLTEQSFPELPSRKAIALMTYREDQARWSVKRGGVELDQCVMRCALAIQGYERGLVDICGQHWPEHIELVENSRAAGDNDPNEFGGWWQRKMELLRPYPFNFAFENTNTDFYATEKIWDAIAGYCLPIYTSRGNRITDDLPDGSFLDYSKLGSPDALWDAMKTMPVSEYRDRLNQCIEVYNRIIAEDRRAKTQDQMRRHLIDRLRAIAGR